jgi:hypothetical protein
VVSILVHWTNSEPSNCCLKKQKKDSSGAFWGRKQAETYQIVIAALKDF